MLLTRGTQSGRGTNVLSGTLVLVVGAYTPWWDQESSSSATPLHFSDLWKSQRQSAEPCHSSASHGAPQAGKHCVNCWCHQNHKDPLRKQFHHLGKLYSSSCSPPSEWLLKHFQKDLCNIAKWAPKHPVSIGELREYPVSAMASPIQENRN